MCSTDIGTAHITDDETTKSLLAASQLREFQTPAQFSLKFAGDRSCREQCSSGLFVKENNRVWWMTFYSIHSIPYSSSGSELWKDFVWITEKVLGKKCGKKLQRNKCKNLIFPPWTEFLCILADIQLPQHPIKTQSCEFFVTFGDWNSSVNSAPTAAQKKSFFFIIFVDDAREEETNRNR